MKNKQNSHHVVPNREGGWDVKRSNSNRISGHYDNKESAVDAGRSISRNQHTELFIHGRHGKIQERDSHGKDPYPPKG